MFSNMIEKKTHHKEYIKTCIKFILDLPTVIGGGLKRIDVKGNRIMLLNSSFHIHYFTLHI